MASAATFAKSVVWNKRLDLGADVYYPSAMRRCPVIILFHGGGFVAFDRTRVRPIAERLAGRGCVVVCPDFRQVRPGVTVLDSVSDARAVLKWTRRKAAKWGASADHTFLMGNSSGAVLASVAAHGAARDGEPPVSGVIFVYSCPDMTTCGPAIQANPHFWSMAGVDPQPFFGRPENTHFESISPRHTLPLTHAIPPYLLVVGTQDKYVTTDSIERFAEEIVHRRGEAQVCIVDGVGHDFLHADFASEASHDVMNVVTNWIHGHAAPGAAHPHAAAQHRSQPLDILGRVALNKIYVTRARSAPA